MDTVRSFLTRNSRPLFAILASLKGMKAGDQIEQSTPTSAMLAVDVSEAGSRPVRVDHDRSTLAIDAKGWGPEDILRRIHLGPHVRPVNHRRRGPLLETDLAYVPMRDPPEPPSDRQVA